MIDAKCGGTNISRSRPLQRFSCHQAATAISKTKQRKRLLRARSCIDISRYNLLRMSPKKPTPPRKRATPNNINKKARVARRVDEDKQHTINHHRRGVLIDIQFVVQEDSEEPTAPDSPPPPSLPPNSTQPTQLQPPPPPPETAQLRQTIEPDQAEPTMFWAVLGKTNCIRKVCKGRASNLHKFGAEKGRQKSIQQ